MAIQFGAPSRFLELSEQNQRILNSMAERRWREGMARNEAMNSAIAGVGANVGESLRTGIMARYRSAQEELRGQREEDAYRNRLAAGAGFQTWDELTAAADERGMSPASVMGQAAAERNEPLEDQRDKRELARARSMGELRLEQQVATAAIQEALRPIELPPETEAALPQILGDDYADFKSLHRQDKRLLSMARMGSELRPEQIIAGRQQLRERMEPALAKIERWKPPTPQQQFEQASWKEPGVGTWVREIRNGREQWRLGFDESKVKKPTTDETLEFDFDGAMKSAIQDIQQLPPEQQPAAMKFARDAVVKQAKEHYVLRGEINQARAEAQQVVIGGEDYGWVESTGRFEPLKKLNADREAAIAQKRADQIVKFMTTPIVESSVDSDGIAVESKRYRTQTEAATLVDELYGRVPPAPTGAAASPADAIAGERRARLAVLASTIKRIRSQALKTQQDQNELDAAESEARQLIEALR